MKKTRVGLQLFTLREDMARDLEGTLRQVAALGYEGIEFAGYFGWQASDLVRLLQELKLTAIGGHLGIDKLGDSEAVKEEIRYMKTIGGRYLTCAHLKGAGTETEQDWQHIFATCRQAAASMHEEGIVFTYHNHAIEFERRIGSECVFDVLMASSDPRHIQIELDVCWVQYAGQDPIGYIRNYAGRLPLLHLKDYSVDAQGQAQTLELGTGLVSISEVIGAACESGVEWLVVEQDRCQKPPLDSVANSMAWLKRHAQILFA
ncbi:sugar phosphate isomerase/epimerase family protein [Paenibacillus hamazuiensis]|uniref:sugar phosphate isomerase/epimerase family protein n=1 Tax=Paenibacillus hamazuiensis TaxID=2936508 RepID=UPI002010ABDA|nr:sugar phosphate isomerase/epimerase [Paenibacillus hamazuiensis]